MSEETIMDKKNFMSQALQLVNRTTDPNVLAQLSTEASDVQELSEEALSQVCGDTWMTVPPAPYFTHNPPDDEFAGRRIVFG